MRACVVGRVYESATSVPLRAFGFACLVSAGGARSLSSATAAVAETGFSRKRVLELSRVLRRCARFVSDSDDLQRPVSFVPDRIVPRVYTSAQLPIGKELVFGCAFGGIACYLSSWKDITQLVCSQLATGGSDLGDERTGDRGVRRQRRAGALLGLLLRLCTRLPCDKQRGSSPRCTRVCILRSSSPRDSRRLCVPAPSCPAGEAVWRSLAVWRPVFGKSSSPAVTSLSSPVDVLSLPLVTRCLFSGIFPEIHSSGVLACE